MLLFEGCATDGQFWLPISHFPPANLKSEGFTTVYRTLWISLKGRKLPQEAYKYIDTDTDTKIIFKNRKYYPVPVHLIEKLPFVKTRKIKKELQYKMKEKYDDLNTIKNNKN